MLLVGGGNFLLFRNKQASLALRSASPPDLYYFLFSSCSYKRLFLASGKREKGKGFCLKVPRFKASGKRLLVIPS